MNDEFKGKMISEFVRVKSYMYFLIAVDGEEIKKAKGVNKNVVKNIRHEEKIFCLIIKLWDKKWKEFKVNYIVLELMMFVNFFV